MTNKSVGQDTMHTQGKLAVAHDHANDIYWLADNDGTTVCDFYFKTEANGGEFFNKFPRQKENAAHLALCWNMHDRLVAIAQEIALLGPGKCSLGKQLVMNARNVLSELNGAS